MRFSLVLALALAGLSITAAAQAHQTPKAKPSYVEEKHSSNGGAKAVKGPVNHSSAAQELLKVEQSSARATGSRKAETSKQVGNNPALKGQKKEANPPINFSNAGSAGHQSKSKSGDPFKGRLRTKGSHH